VAKEGVCSEQNVGAYRFVTHIAEFVKEFALRWNERGDFELSTRLSTHYLETEKVASTRQWMTMPRKVVKAAWFKALNKPYIPLSLNSREGTFITFLHLSSFFCLYSLLSLLALFVFFMEKVHSSTLGSRQREFRSSLNALLSVCMEYCLSVHLCVRNVVRAFKRS